MKILIYSTCFCQLQAASRPWWLSCTRIGRAAPANGAGKIEVTVVTRTRRPLDGDDSLPYGWCEPESPEVIRFVRESDMSMSRDPRCFRWRWAWHLANPLISGAPRIPIDLSQRIARFIQAGPQSLPGIFHAEAIPDVHSMQHRNLAGKKLAKSVNFNVSAPMDVPKGSRNIAVTEHVASAFRFHEQSDLSRDRKTYRDSARSRFLKATEIRCR